MACFNNLVFIHLDFLGTISDHSGPFQGVNQSFLCSWVPKSEKLTLSTYQGVFEKEYPGVCHVLISNLIISYLLNPRKVAFLSMHQSIFDALWGIWSIKTFWIFETFKPPLNWQKNFKTFTRLFWSSVISTFW